MRGLPYLLTGLLVVSLAIQSGAQASGAPGWELVPPPPNVPFGSPIDLSVMGPSGAQFAVTINAQPYNSSSPVFSNVYTMPKGLSNSSAAVLNLSIPTNLFDLGEYQVSVATTTGLPIGNPAVFGIVSPVNFSALPGELATIWATLNATLAEYANTNAQLDHTQTDFFVSVSVNFVFGFILIGFMVFTRTRAAETRLGDRLRRAGQRLMWGEPGIRFGYDKDVRDVPPVNPAVVFTGLMFPDCPRCSVVQSEDSIVRHLKAPAVEDSKVTGHAVAQPIRGIHYTASKSVRRIVTRARSADEADPDKLAKLLSTPGRSLRVDMGED